jgi:Rps23 Pro-64 3,4-dihydroxylase Tpa1-like proline 4-hydroxylase
MFLKYIENFLTNDECDSIIEIGESVGLSQMKSSLIVNGNIIEQNVEYDGNKRMGCYFFDELLENQLIKTVSNKIIDLSNNLNPFNGIVYNKIPKYSFNRYSVGDFLDWHPDNHEILNGATITFVIQLNDDYEGGDVKYMINGEEISVPKKKGSVFIFDSNILHSVDKVTEGLRYSINVWPSSLIKKSLL